MQVGITRIKIKSDWYDWRTKLEDDHHPVAIDIYRDIFNELSMPLAEGNEIVEVTKQEAMARYDWREGIDLIFITKNRQRMTAQAKFLTYYKSTATFEEKKTSGELGVWYNCTAQYYFIGYTREYWNFRERRLYPNPIIGFQDWMMLDLAAVRRCDAAGLICWEYNKNHFDNRRSSFRYISFDTIPSNCIISRHVDDSYQYGLFN